jgi:hypothetical protein
MTQPPGGDAQGHPDDQPGVRFYPQQPYEPPPAPAYQTQTYPPAPSYQAPSYQAPSVYAPPEYPAPAPARQKTDGFAIASLVFGIIGGLLFAVIFGIVGLRRTKRNGTRGRGLAIAGLVLTLVWVLAIGGSIAAYMLTRAGRDASGKVTGSGREAAASVRLGDCIETWPKDGVVVNLQVTPCTQAHQAEVFAVEQLPPGSYPGSAVVKTQTEALCATKVLGAIKESEATGLALGFLFPQASTWGQGDRKITCIAITKSGSRTSSVRT